ncbi:MAG: multidrug efflux system outer membrane protein [Verrucomicrobiales bacterium]|jgi:multidrug efflux system outer membrane protein
MKHLAILTLLAATLSGCGTLADRLSPKGGQPSTPKSFKQESASTKKPSKRIESWWKIFDDPTLNKLVKRLHDNNPDLAAAMARLDQSYATVGQTRAGLFPTLRGTGSAGRQRDSLNQLLFPISEPEYARYRLGASATWEIDLWGRVRSMAKRDQLQAEREKELFYDAQLSLETNLARQYLAWQFARKEVEILTEAIRVREEDFRLQEARLELGSGIEVDVSRSRVELSTAQSAAEAASRSQGKLEHAIAVLVGLAPSEMKSLAPAKTITPPKVPAGLPSSLVEQRPDLRAADKHLRSAAAQVGVRNVDFLPRISLTGSGGVASLRSSNLFDPNSKFFNVGPEIDVPLFQAGKARSADAEAKAAWRESAADYRSTLLEAVREVDDALLDLKSLARELTSQQRAVTAAHDTSEIARLRHERGLASYFEVVEAERERLTARRAENALQGERLAATVRLIQALGGTW